MFFTPGSAPAGPELTGIVHFGADCEGPPLCVHGGCSAAAIDAALGVFAWRAKRQPCVTASLTLNYKRTVPLGSTCRLQCAVARTEGRKLYLTFRMGPLNPEEPAFVEGEALFVTPKVGALHKGQ